MSALILIFTFGVIAAAAGAGLAIYTNPDAAQKQQNTLSAQTLPKDYRRVQFIVRIVDKRIRTVDNSSEPGAKYSYVAACRNLYFMTFETQDGTRTELEIPEAVFCGNLAGFIGTLTCGSGPEGLRFIDFTRDLKYRVNGL